MPLYVQTIILRFLSLLAYHLIYDLKYKSVENIKQKVHDWKIKNLARKSSVFNFCIYRVNIYSSIFGVVFFGKFKTFKKRHTEINWPLGLLIRNPSCHTVKRSTQKPLKMDPALLNNFEIKEKKRTEIDM